MPKITKDPVSPITVGLRKKHLHFLERTGTGDNPGAKLRSILDHCMETFDNVEGIDGAILAYDEHDGEKIWTEKLPFPFKKSDGWKALEKSARGGKYVCQIIEDKNAGSIQVWIAPSYKLNDCAACRQRVLEVMHG
jgi:hypothetical protein